MMFSIITTTALYTRESYAVFLSRVWRFRWQVLEDCHVETFLSRGVWSLSPLHFSVHTCYVISPTTWRHFDGVCWDPTITTPTEGTFLVSFIITQHLPHILYVAFSFHSALVSNEASFWTCARIVSPEKWIWLQEPNLNTFLSTQKAGHWCFGWMAVHTKL